MRLVGSGVVRGIVRHVVLLLGGRRRARNVGEVELWHRAPLLGEPIEQVPYAAEANVLLHRVKVLLLDVPRGRQRVGR